MNSITVTGNLGQDAVLSFTQTGKSVCNFSVGSRVSFAKQGDNTLWFKVAIWGEYAKSMAPYLVKGQHVTIKGRVEKPEVWQSKQDGSWQTSLRVTADEIELGPSRQNQNQNQNQQVTQEEEALPF